MRGKSLFCSLLRLITSYRFHFVNPQNVNLWKIDHYQSWPQLLPVLLSEKRCPGQIEVTKWLIAGDWLPRPCSSWASTDWKVPGPQLIYYRPAQPHTMEGKHGSPLLPRGTETWPAQYWERWHHWGVMRLAYYKPHWYKPKLWRVGCVSVFSMSYQHSFNLFTIAEPMGKEQVCRAGSPGKRMEAMKGDTNGSKAVIARPMEMVT